MSTIPSSTRALVVLLQSAYNATFEYINKNNTTTK